jgi:uncharacterized protein GlcG (DUF336 family)
VFFPGPDGYASFEQDFRPGEGQTEFERTNAPKVLESEFIAVAAAGGSIQAEAAVGAIGGIPALTGVDLPFGRIFLVGIDLETVGPHPNGVQTLLAFGRGLAPGNIASGANQQISPDPTDFSTNGLPVPEGWLVAPHASPTGSISQQDVERIIQQGIDEANLVRAQIRLDIGNRTRMVLAVADTDGNVLGVFRMQDSTIFSIDVAVAKARNVAYYADANDIQPIDLVDDDGNGTPDLPAGVAFSNRTFRFLSEARFPSGVEQSRAGAFSMLLDPGINPLNAENIGANAGNPNGLRFAPAVYDSVVGNDSFFPGSNFRDPGDGAIGRANQNGIVFFPGSLPLYNDNGILVGGWGVSGDGVDQDDVVTFSGAQGFLPRGNVLRADQVFVRNVRLPITSFPRNPRG